MRAAKQHMSEVAVAAVNSGDLRRVLPLLRVFEKNTPGLGDRQWRRMFDYRWASDSLVRGYALVAGAEWVGFRGCIQHQRVLRGELHRIVSTTSWVVRPEYRKQTTSPGGGRLSDLLLDAVDDWHRRETMTSVAMSVRPELTDRFKARGYEVLETETAMWPTLGRPRWDGWRVEHRPDRVRDRLNETQARLFDDHRSLPCLQLVVTRGKEKCYLVLCLRRSGRVSRLARIVHLSDAGVFESALGALGWFLLTRYRVRWLEWDMRWLRGRLPAGALRRRLASPRMFKSAVLEPAEIDNLYSEIVLLEL